MCDPLYFFTPRKHYLLKNLLSFIANDPNCLGRSNGWYWEFTNTESSSSSNCLFDREINGTHVIYKTTVESKLPAAEISPLITRSRNLIMDFTCSLEVSSSSNPEKCRPFLKPSSKLSSIHFVYFRQQLMFPSKVPLIQNTITIDTKLKKMETLNSK